MLTRHVVGSAHRSEEGNEQADEAQHTTQGAGVVNRAVGIAEGEHGDGGRLREARVVAHDWIDVGLAHVPHELVAVPNQSEQRAQHAHERDVEKHGGSGHGGREVGLDKGDEHLRFDGGRHLGVDLRHHFG